MQLIEPSLIYLCQYADQSTKFKHNQGIGDI